ncbi:MAG: hypothetical protein J7463_00405 [Roseiflexus sp.]|nr:hypothetical protein [Roseiflexus sp.]MBO9336480.1 hypothetical protein [Roseiflexus sp.]MBO9364179.1 hypothetical protein [Roseiflexus sp.]MBO9381957.1 hypothetical protein [Roseiflexus sp.]MBO9388516.1 hypothetical protein [Roseiflexus sp.]
MRPEVDLRPISQHQRCDRTIPCFGFGADHTSFCDRCANIEFTGARIMFRRQAFDTFGNQPTTRLDRDAGIHMAAQHCPFDRIHRRRIVLPAAVTGNGNQHAEQSEEHEQPRPRDALVVDLFRLWSGSMCHSLWYLSGRRIRNASRPADTGRVPTD